MLMTSLAEIKSFNPCLSGWKAILKGRDKTQADALYFPLVECVESNSISDVCWLLGKRKVERQILVLFAKECANSVSHLKGCNAYAADAAAAAYAAYAAAAAAAYAADAAAAYAAAAAAAAAAYAARKDQNEKNKQFLRNAILNYRDQS